MNAVWITLFQSIMKLTLVFLLIFFVTVQLVWSAAETSQAENDPIGRLTRLNRELHRCSSRTCCDRKYMCCERRKWCCDRSGKKVEGVTFC
ncbi:unnamed protein product [Nezara viridula]|uniref:Neuropeptide n=1 Tax=Nezara viridula TaxID=85310 RepID=A0A9P0MSU3_NEZVI|nr:unnamed protein product [Nezara viridula]